MPNIVNDYLTVSGPEDAVKRFHGEFCQDGKLSMAGVIPVPKKYLDDPKFWDCKGSSPLWYKVHCALWGTKWELDEEDCKATEPEKCGSHYATLDSEPTDIWESRYEFWTAWGPPIEFLLRAAAKYPQLEFLLKFDGEVDEPGELLLVPGDEPQYRILVDKTLGYETLPHEGQALLDNLDEEIERQDKMYSAVLEAAKKLPN